MNDQEVELIGLTDQEIARKLAAYDLNGTLNARHMARWRGGGTMRR